MNSENIIAALFVLVIVAGFGGLYWIRKHPDAD